MQMLRATTTNQRKECLAETKRKRRRDKNNNRRELFHSLAWPHCLLIRRRPLSIFVHILFRCSFLLSLSFDSFSLDGFHHFVISHFLLFDRDNLLVVGARLHGPGDMV